MVGGPRRKTAPAYYDMREGGEAASAPPMEVFLTQEGEAASYARVDLGDPSEGEVEKEDAAGRPGGDQEEEAGEMGR